MTVGSAADPEPRRPVEPGRLRAGPARQRRLPDAGEHLDRPARRRRRLRVERRPCTFLRVRVRRRDPAAPGRSTSTCARARATRSTRTGAATTTWTRSRRGRSLAPRRIYQREARYDVATGALISDLPRASTTGKLIDPDLKPTYNDEWLAGYATPIAGGWSVDVFYMYRNTKNFIEDVPSVYPVDGPLRGGQPALHALRGVRGARGQAQVPGRHGGVNRRFANRWSANVSYTWSQFEGNFDLDYAGATAVFNTSSIIQDGPGTFVEDPYRYGPLRQDRPHVFKVFANWEPINNLMLGGYLRVQSGTPWKARGQDSQGGSALYYLEPAGSHRNPTWTNFDLLASYRFKLSRPGGPGRRGARPQPVQQPDAAVDGLGEVHGLQEPAGGSFIAEGTILNSFFGTANGYAAGRRIVLAARLDF